MCLLQYAMQTFRMRENRQAVMLETSPLLKPIKSCLVCKRRWKRRMDVQSFVSLLKFLAFSEKSAKKPWAVAWPVRFRQEIDSMLVSLTQHAYYCSTGMCPSVRLSVCVSALKGKLDVIDSQFNATQMFQAISRLRFINSWASRVRKSLDLNRSADTSQSIVPMTETTGSVLYFWH